MSADFLVEIGTEELPPKSLLLLSNAFRDGIAKRLQEHQLSFTAIHAYASPRRLAVKVHSLASQAPQQEIIAWGPPANIAFDEKGNPSKAALAFAGKNNIDPATLHTLVANDGKQDKLCYRSVTEGAQTATHIGDIVAAALDALPIAKRMRWGVSRWEFVRPVHWLVMLYGDDIVDACILGIKAGRISQGHRIHCKQAIEINSADDYLDRLRACYVIADFDARRTLIRKQVEAVAKDAGGTAVIDADLLDEVTALNEWPTALVGQFDADFLQVPQEALISSMKEHQKYFHIIDPQDDRLLPFFVTISNIESKDPAQVIAGNERVIRPRLADAAFFYATDKKTSLEYKRQHLKKIVFQAKLGTLYSKTERIAHLAEFLAPEVGADAAIARRAAELCKSDLVSAMVMEFPDLQGIMGRYYALHDGETEEVAAALFEHYLPRFAGDKLPTTKTGAVLAIADRIDTLVGIFGIGMTPTGSKDPFALRRASLGVLRLLVEQRIDIDLYEVLQQAVVLYGELPTANTAENVLDYMLERFRAWYEEEHIPTEVFMSVAEKKLTNPLDIHQRVLAVNEFNQLPQAVALASANKRVSNILAKSDVPILPQVIEAKLENESERYFYRALETVEINVTPLIEVRNYTAALKHMSELQGAVDSFFENVMVNVEDKETRQNRLTILYRMHKFFLKIADISLLVPEK